MDIARGKRFKIGDYLSPLEHVPVVTSVRYSLQMQYQARQRITKWQPHKMRMAGDDIKYREPFLKEVLEWVKDNQDVKDRYKDDPSPSACWQFVHNAILDISKKHFEANANTPKASWMSTETWEKFVHIMDIKTELHHDQGNEELIDKERRAIKRARGASRQDKKRAMIDIANDMRSNRLSIEITGLYGLEGGSLQKQA